MMKPKIAIFQPHEDTFTNPTVVNFLKRLSSLNFGIDLYIPKSKKSVYLQEKLFQFPSYPVLRIVWRSGLHASLDSVLHFYNNTKFYSIIRNKEYDLVFAIDPDGLIAAYQLIKRNHAPLFYFSFEIFFQHELRSSREKKIKSWEIEASKFVDCVIIQDEQRWKLLKKENDIQHNNVIYMPVAPAGPSEREKTAYLREKLNIPLEKTIVLFSQGIGSWSGVEELVEEAHTWSDKFILVIHSRNFVNDPEFLENINAKCNPNKVKFDLEPVPFNKYSDLVSSADIGLVLRKYYNNKYTGDNIRYVGLSSGTLSTYMKHGLPVISNNEHSHKDIFTKHRCGVYVKDFSEIEEALDIIDLNYEGMRNNCFSFFEDVLDFDGHFDQLMSKIATYLK